jgi:hypothetical protein
MRMSVDSNHLVRAAQSLRGSANAAAVLGFEVAVEANRVRMERGWARELGRDVADGPVVAGPWISEVGFEVLYWVPLLRRIAETQGIAPERITAFTRGGAHCWYRDFAAHGVEIFDLVEPDELRERNERRVDATGGQKHMGVTALDRELAALAADRLPAGAGLLHPSLMYNAFRYFWSWRSPPKAVLRHLSLKPLPDPGRRDIAERLPDDYVAVKAYHSACFPPTPENRAFVENLVARIATHTNVVLLSTGLQVDDHSEVEVEGGHVIDAQPWMTPQDNLEVQTQIISGARCLISSYGGFSYLGPLLGVPSVCFWSVANFNPTHLELMRRVVDAMDAPRFVALDTADLRMLEAVLNSELLAAVG